MGKPLTSEMRRQLQELALLRDQDIDTSDIPEVSDWSQASRPEATAVRYATADYDIRGLANHVLKSAWAKGLEVSNMSLNKLVFFVLEKALLERNVWLTKARLEAWDHGPVFREIYTHSKRFKDQPVTELLKSYSVKGRCFSEVEQSIDDDTAEDIDFVVKKLAHQPASVLRAISHSRDSAWEWVYNAHGKSSVGMVISPIMVLASAHRRAAKHGGR